ncbi:MAG: hypothetical protein ACOC5R_01590 [Elusimicrobiota bacterium]
MNENKIADIIKKTCQKLDLNLKGQTVLTEAANYCYAATACIPAYAGAEVYAYAEDNKYSSKKEAINDVEKLAEELGVEKKITFIDDIYKKLGKADIITNSYSLRPLNEKKLSRLKPGAKVLLMYEKWEKRDEDIDYEFCKENNIIVIPTDEHYGEINVFDYVGLITVKFLLENNYSILRDTITIIGSDNFGETVVKYLKNNGAHIKQVRNSNDYEMFKDSGLFIYCDYFNEIDISWEKVKKINPNGNLFPLLGMKNYSDLMKNNILIINNIMPDYQKMACTFDYLGCKPVVEIISLSFKGATQ